MPYLSESDLWLEVRAGNAMTERYAVTLQHTTYYLLQLQKDTLLELLNVSDSEKAILYTPVMRLIQAVLPAFLDRSPRTTDLYFLVMLTSPVLRNFDTGYWGVPIREKLSRYTQEVSMIFTASENTSAHYYLSNTRTLFILTLILFFLSKSYQALKQFPFLNDSTSLDYIKAKRNVEEAFVSRKIKTSFHELVGRTKLTKKELVSYKELLDSFVVIDRRVTESG